MAASPHAHRSAGLAYLDNAATTLKPRCVLQAVEDFYAAGGGNPYRGAYQESIAATRAYEGARATVAAFAGALPGEIVFTRNATEALNLVAYSYALDRLHEGDRDSPSRVGASQQPGALAARVPEDPARGWPIWRWMHAAVCAKASWNASWGRARS